MANPVILLVGHCGPDSYALRSAVGRAVPDAEIVFVHDAQELDEQLRRAHLLLVNRVLECGFETTSGIDLIGEVLAAPAGEQGPVRCMLVSNFPEAQARAEAVGALPGFGKKEMYAEQTAQRLRGAAGVMSGP